MHYPDAGCLVKERRSRSVFFHFIMNQSLSAPRPSCMPSAGNNVSVKMVGQVNHSDRRDFLCIEMIKKKKKTVAASVFFLDINHIISAKLYYKSAVSCEMP